LKHQYGVLFVLACKPADDPSFSQLVADMDDNLYLQTFGTILITFCTNFYPT